MWHSKKKKNQTVGRCGQSDPNVWMTITKKEQCSLVYRFNAAGENTVMTYIQETKLIGFVMCSYSAWKGIAQQRQLSLTCTQNLFRDIVLDVWRWIKSCRPAWPIWYQSVRRTWVLFRDVSCSKVFAWLAVSQTERRSFIFERNKCCTCWDEAHLSGPDQHISCVHLLLLLFVSICTKIVSDLILLLRFRCKNAVVQQIRKRVDEVENVWCGIHIVQVRLLARCRCPDDLARWSSALRRTL